MKPESQNLPAPRGTLKSHPLPSAAAFLQKLTSENFSGPDRERLEKEAVDELLSRLNWSDVTCLELHGQQLIGPCGKVLQASLEHASCPLQELDLSGSEVALTVLHGAAKNQRLTRLKLANVSFPSILDPHFPVMALAAVVASPSLTHLDFRGVNLVNTHGSTAFQTFCSTLDQKKNLKSLELAATGLRERHLCRLIDALMAHGQLEYLGLGENDFRWGDEVAGKFVALFASRSLKHLVLPRPEMTQDDFDLQILRMLENNTTLIVLEPYSAPAHELPKEVSSSRVYDVRMKLARNRFDGNRRLPAQACALSISPTPPLAECLRQMTPEGLGRVLTSQRISRLLLQGARFDEKSVWTLAHVLGEPACKVTELDLTGAEFATMGELFSKLKNNTSLRRLCLGGVSVVNERGTFPLQARHLSAIAEFLTCTRTLHTLMLGSQGTLGTDKTALQKLMESLQKNVSLKCLDLSATRLSKEHLSSISSALQRHALEDLNLDSNALCWGRELKSFLNGLAQNESLLTLVMPEGVRKHDKVIKYLYNMRAGLHLCHFPPFTNGTPKFGLGTKRAAIRKRLIDNQQRHAEKPETDQFRVKTVMLALKEAHCQVPQDMRVITARQLIQITSAGLRV